NFGVPEGRKAGSTESLGAASGFCAATAVASPGRTGGTARSAWPPLQPVSTDAATITDDTQSRTARPCDVMGPSRPPAPADASLAPEIGSSFGTERCRKDGRSE